VNRVRVEVDASGVCECWNEGGRDIEVRLLELEKFDFGRSEANCDNLRALTDRVLRVVDIRPTEASKVTVTPAPNPKSRNASSPELP